MREGWEGAWLEWHLIIASARACESQEGKKARSFHLTYNSTLLTPRPNPARRRPPSRIEGGTSSQVKIVGLQCRRLCGSSSAALNAVHLSPPPAAADHPLQLQLAYRFRDSQGRSSRCSCGGEKLKLGSAIIPCKHLKPVDLQIRGIKKNLPSRASRSELRVSRWPEGGFDDLGDICSIE